MQQLSHFQAALSVNKNHQSANKRHPSQLRQQQKGSLKTIIPFQAAYLCFCLNNRAYFANATQCLIQLQQTFLADRFACFQAAFVGEQG